MARVSLTLPCGAELKIGSTLILGREHAMGQQAAYVSKEQASLSFSNGALTLTSVAKTNATIVMRGTPANLLKICHGQSYVLQHGDQVGLTGKFQLVDVAIYPSTDDAACPSPPRAQAEAPAAASSPINQTKEAEEATESGPPSKRALRRVPGARQPYRRGRDHGDAVVRLCTRGRHGLGAARRRAARRRIISGWVTPLIRWSRSGRMVGVGAS
ncbi:hypothetical protein T492DRAFT_1083830 [Pavlovales sp. CCMP2436]|nr:hypothetical protein T492DRAFT_1083830 [Pavlovales sp. CCMP2436]|mmetsp:Transcript_39979/g.98900  ORF Transcript_39979/g.98900 Transcript_39979/m.98900 type:complete len:214 (-) Transcript_39979:50-691(-)